MLGANEVAVKGETLVYLETGARYAFDHFYHADKANAAIHMAPVKFSPIVFYLAEALIASGYEGEDLREVIAHRGKYPIDTGR